MAKSAIWGKRNPENPASDKDMRPPPETRRECRAANPLAFFPAVIPAKACESGIRRVAYPPETKRESQTTNPFPLYGGRLGWGSRAQARLCGRDARAPRVANLPFCQSLTGEGWDRRAARKPRLSPDDASA